jgi:hypothetical protein
MRRIEERRKNALMAQKPVNASSAKKPSCSPISTKECNPSTEKKAKSDERSAVEWSKHVKELYNKGVDKKGCLVAKPSSSKVLNVEQFSCCCRARRKIKHFWLKVRSWFSEHSGPVC